MIKRTYRVNLRGIEIGSFLLNPIVLRSFRYGADDVIGRARILKGKTTVEVEYLDGVPKYHHAIGTAVGSNNHGKSELMALAVIPEITV